MQTPDMPVPKTDKQTYFLALKPIAQTNNLAQGLPIEIAQ